MTIGDWRKKIDEIDTVLLQLLNLRTDFALEVARLKEEEGLSVCAPEREQKVLASMQNLNTGPLDRKAVTRIFQLVMEETRRTEELNAGRGGAVADRREVPRKARPVGKRRQAGGAT
jgi:chorismate mutase-like protein